METKLDVKDNKIKTKVEKDAEPNIKLDSEKIESRKLTLEEKRNDFRKYLQTTGAIDKLTTVLLKLFHTSPRPDDAIKFIRDNLCDTCEDLDEKLLELQKEVEILRAGKLPESKNTDPDAPTSNISLKMEQGLEGLKEDSECQNVLKKVMTEDIYEELYGVESEFKGRLLDCIQAGLNHRGTDVGVFACDASAYKSFKSLFDPIIEELHEPFLASDKHPETDWGDAKELEDLDPEEFFIKTTRIMCYRSLENSPFHSIDNEENMIANCTKIAAHLKKLSGELKGQFYDYEDLQENQTELRDQLKAGNLWFEDNDETLRAAKNYRFWPKARGIFVSEDKKLVIWVNAEEHLQIISQEESGQLNSVYDRIVKCMKQLGTSEDLKFNRDDQWGFLNFNPANIGIALRATISIKLNNAGLKENTEQLEAIATSNKIKIDGVVKKKKKVKIEEGEGDKNDEDPDTKKEEPKNEFKTVYTLTSNHLMGITEIEAMKEFQKGIQEVIHLEKCVS